MVCACAGPGRRHRVVVPYKESDVDFIVVYVIPEETWYVIPVREVAVRTSMAIRPKGYARGDPYATAKPGTSCANPTASPSDKPQV